MMAGVPATRVWEPITILKGLSVSAEVFVPDGMTVVGLAIEYTVPDMVMGAPPGRSVLL